MTYAKVRDAAQEAAKRGTLTPHQLAALGRLDEILTDAQREEFTSLWRAAGSPAEPVPGKFPNPLPVPFFAQTDSSTDQGSRMCFSSSCAMLVEFLRPGSLRGANGDDEYLRRVMRYGDTTDAGAQLQALASYGVKATFTQTADFKLIDQQIAKGVPVPCGYLHRGPVDRPRGGGHWLCCIGTTPNAVIVHDPWGEADLITGETLPRTGRGCTYSRVNFGHRWMVQQLPGGGFRYAPGNGWAIIAEPV